MKHLLRITITIFLFAIIIFVSCSSQGDKSLQSPTSTIHYSGRFDRTNPSEPRFAWSGTTIYARFSGTGISVKLKSGMKNFFEVLIDNAPVSPIETTSGEETFLLASGLELKEHDVMIVRRTEASMGPVSFLGFTVQDGSLLKSASPWSHRIEFIGDSITTGYGVLGADQNCSFSAETESAWHAYAAVAGRELNAETHIIAFSAKGVYLNYGGSTDEPMPSLYGRTIPTESSSSYSFSFNPEAVVIFLGMNDFSNSVNQSAFETAYRNLIQLVRSHSSGAAIYCVYAEGRIGTAATGKTYISNAITASGDDNTYLLELTTEVPADGYGCDWHPSETTQGKWGGQVADRISADLGW